MPSAKDGTTPPPPGLVALYRETRAIANDAGSAIDQPHAVVRLMVLDAMSLFRRLSGRAPRLLYLPKAVEAALEVDKARAFNEHVHLRKLELVFGLRPVWDAAEFKVE